MTINTNLVSNGEPFDIHSGKTVIAEGSYNSATNTVTINDVGNTVLSPAVTLTGLAATLFVDVVNAGHWWETP